MKCVVYRSTAAPGLTEDDVRALVEAAQIRNSRHNISGLLVFNGSHFLQLIEGDDLDVDYLMGLILADPRHDGLVVLSEQAVSGRAFPDWSMQLMTPDAFKQIPDAMLTKLPHTARDALGLGSV